MGVGLPFSKTRLFPVPSPPPPPPIPTLPNRHMTWMVKPENHTFFSALNIPLFVCGTQNVGASIKDFMKLSVVLSRSQGSRTCRSRISLHGKRLPPPSQNFFFPRFLSLTSCYEMETETDPAGLQGLVREWPKWRNGRSARTTADFFCILHLPTTSTSCSKWPAGLSEADRSASVISGPVIY